MPRLKKPPPKPVTDRVTATFTLERELLEQIDALAGREERPRSKVIEFACREYVQAHQRRPAAA